MFESTSPLLSLPLEIRRQIWTFVLTPSQPLTMRSLFIRAHYRSIFMTQQPKQINTSILRVCRSITAECLPILYSLPHWRSACRFESLASQVGIENFGHITRMSVDVDDLPSIVGSLLLDMQERNGEQDLLGDQCRSSIELKLELESRALLENMISSGPVTWQANAPPAGTISPWPPTQRRLKFLNLELLEVEGYQTIALTNRGNRKSRLEGLRLCRFARDILAYHPTLCVLVQAEKLGYGSSDAVDMTMGRVRWRFLRNELGKVSHEHVVDLEGLEALLRALIEMDDEDERVRRRKTLAGWMENGRFQQYPYLSTATRG